MSSVQHLRNIFYAFLVSSMCELCYPSFRDSINLNFWGGSGVLSLVIKLSHYAFVEINMLLIPSYIICILLYAI